MSEIICISPIDGSVVARRATASAAQIDAALVSARKAQAEWSRVPVKERAAAMLRFLEAMRTLNGEIVPELARQMGRPVRYGGEFRSLEERVKYMADIAEAALAPLTPEPKAGFTRFVRRDPLGVILTVAPWNYPFLTAVNTVVPGLRRARRSRELHGLCRRRARGGTRSGWHIHVHWVGARGQGPRVRAR
jgi:acyl-CoA reductase-like NAD-dependent aldehyde dehydrogenase